MSEEEKLETLKNKFLKYHLEYEDEEMLFEIIGRLQKDNYKLDRENQLYFDKIQDLQKENEELKEDNKKLCAEIRDLKELLGE